MNNMPWVYTYNVWSEQITRKRQMRVGHDPKNLLPPSDQKKKELKNKLKNATHLD